jgi:hypothetical protein
VDAWHHKDCPLLVDGCSQRAKYSPECAGWLKKASVACSRLDAAAIAHQLSPQEQQQQQELIERLQGQLSAMSARCSSLEQEKQDLLQRHAEEIEASRRTMVQVDAALDADLRHMLQQPAVQRGMKQNPGTYAMLLDQLNYLGLKDTRGQRWHPAVIRLALDIYAKGSVSLIDAISKSGVLRLPSGRHLRRLRQFCSNGSGFDEAPHEPAVSDAGMHSCRRPLAVVLVPAPGLELCCIGT